MISKHFIWNSNHLKTILSGKPIILRVLLIRVLGCFLITMHLKLFFRMYLKEMFLLSLRSRRELQKLFTDKLTFVLQNRFCVTCLIQSFFTFKDKLPKMFLSGLIYKYNCRGCNATYYGRNKRHFSVQIWEYLGVSNLTGKKAKIDNSKLTAIQEHLLCCKWSQTYENVSILTKENNDVKLKIMKSQLTAGDKLDKPNKTGYSFPLELFWW